ncbi:DUF4249 domain-containing protein [Adhaeribacter arboris]|uniref:DUF4249 domain-containing protein n=1 Tax=Adhaeribacter arboris TaxID=2072846 RepID=A0A2T2YI38_9BACT|nr:DUF4249 domain-containing protein [Adhaeribacter arboris]PSR55174.1 DUF4249 domain-containing protein [Adhaeribacter arboris]
MRLKKGNFINCFIWLLWLLLSSCVEPYEPKVLRSVSKFLVVDGFINSQGITTIKLARTLNLTDTLNLPEPETKAQVQVEEENGAPYLLTEKNPGTYVSGKQTLHASRRYRLLIQTAAGTKYASAFVSVRPTPEIDSVSWRVESNGLQIYVDTHDPQNNTHYYRWEYENTWEFTPPYNSVLSYVIDTVLIRRDDIYHCWKTEISPRISISNSIKLSQDVIAQYPLLFLPAGSEKLRYRYSILVKQYAQTAEEYQYWEMLQKNTEQIGGLTDPLPSRLTGNIQNLTNPDEPVIGYIGAYSLREKRIFITNEELPQEWVYESGYSDCEEPFPIYLGDNIAAYLKAGKYIPLYPIARPGLIGYYIASQECTDCRLKGTNMKPDFWP